MVASVIRRRHVATVVVAAVSAVAIGSAHASGGAQWPERLVMRVAVETGVVSTRRTS
jgi:hypothetical protein